MAFARTFATPAAVAVLLAAACSREAGSPSRLTGDYLGQKPPGRTAELFAPGIVSTGMAERDVAMTPDGSELYFTVTNGIHGTIVVVRRMNGVWTAPEVATFSGHWSDYEPAISPDGRRFFFASTRPREPGATEPGDSDIWVMERTGAEWGEPRNLGAPVNSEHNEYFPSLTRDGTLYFTGRGERGEAIFRSRPVDGRYQEREQLPAQINTTAQQFNAYVAPDESYVIFGSAPRKGDQGGGDYQICFRNPDDTWTDAQNMGPAVNSAAAEWSPYVSPDGKVFFFHSTRNAVSDPAPTALRYADLQAMLNRPATGLSDIYWIDASLIGELRRKSGARGG
jgi:Tol biopolymer transport system component